MFHWPPPACSPFGGGGLSLRIKWANPGGGHFPGAWYLYAHLEGFGGLFLALCFSTPFGLTAERDMRCGEARVPLPTPDLLVVLACPLPLWRGQIGPRVASTHPTCAPHVVPASMRCHPLICTCSGSALRALPSVPPGPGPPNDLPLWSRSLFFCQLRALGTTTTKFFCCDCQKKPCVLYDSPNIPLFLLFC